MEDKKEALEPEILEGIKPFSGVPSVETGMERMIGEGKAIQKVQTQYTTAVAVQEPRSIAKVTHNVLEEAKLAGASFYYRWEVKTKTGGKKVVQGGSIDLGMCLARNYGNCVVDIEGTETPTHFMLKGVFIDLETGFTVPRLYRQRKSQSIGGGYGDDRSEDIVFQIAQSKAQRNAILKAMPAWLMDKAIETARDAEIGKIKGDNLPLARAKVIDFFAPYGITQERIEAKIEIDADHWTAENIADLRASATALKEGRITANELFPSVEAEQKAADLTDKVKEKPKYKATEIKNTSAQDLKVKLDAGDKEAGGYSGIKPTFDAATGEDLDPAPKGTPEQPLLLLPAGVEPIAWLTTSKPRASVRNAKLTIAIYDANEKAILNDIDAQLKLKIQGKRLSATAYLDEIEGRKQGPDEPPFEQQNNQQPEYDANGRRAFLAKMKEYKEKNDDIYAGVLMDNSTEEDPINGMNDIKTKDEEAILHFMAQAFGEG